MDAWRMGSVRTEARHGEHRVAGSWGMAGPHTHQNSLVATI